MQAPPRPWASWSWGPRAERRRRYRQPRWQRVPQNHIIMMLEDQPKRQWLDLDELPPARSRPRGPPRVMDLLAPTAEPRWLASLDRDYETLHVRRPPPPPPDFPPRAFPAPAPTPAPVSEWLAWAVPVAGAILMLLAAHVTAKYSNWEVFRYIRRRRREWMLPNIAAQLARPRLDPFRMSPVSVWETVIDTPSMEFPVADVPPPSYAECVSSPGGIEGEESPPPYSTCYVNLENIDGVPIVRYYTRRRDGNEADGNEASGETNTNLVFENGRVLEVDADNSGEDESTGENGQDNDSGRATPDSDKDLYENFSVRNPAV